MRYGLSTLLLMTTAIAVVLGIALHPAILLFFAAVWFLISFLVAFWCNGEEPCCTFLGWLMLPLAVLVAPIVLAVDDR